MTPFTDDDLKRFKEWSKDCFYTDKFYCRTSEIDALLARLEAAEYFIHIGAELNGVSTAQVKAAEEAWRKACGKEPE